MEFAEQIKTLSTEELVQLVKDVAPELNEGLNPANQCGVSVGSKEAIAALREDKCNFIMAFVPIQYFDPQHGGVPSWGSPINPSYELYRLDTGSEENNHKLRQLSIEFMERLPLAKKL